MWVARAKRRQLIKHRPILSVILFGVGYTRYREDVDENYPGEENPSRRPCVPQMSGCPHASNRVGMAGKNRRSVGGAPERPRKSWDAFGASISDRKSTRLNSSHVAISYAVFCLKKKKTQKQAR